MRPPVPVAWNTRQSYAVAQPLGDRGDAGRGHPEHRQPDRRPAVGRHRRSCRHGDDRLRGIVEDDAADPVQAGHIGDRRHHDDVGDADIGRYVAEASVETMILGRPSGSSRMPAVTIEVPPPPPMPTMPAMSSAGSDEARRRLRPLPPRRAAVVRGERLGRFGGPRAVGAATIRLCRNVRPAIAASLVPTSTSEPAFAARARFDLPRSARKASSSSLGVGGADHVDALHRGPPG